MNINDKQTIGPNLDREDNLSSVKSITYNGKTKIATVMFYDEEQKLVSGYWTRIDAIRIVKNTETEERDVFDSYVLLVFPDDNGVPTTANGAVWITEENNATILNVGNELYR